MRNLFFEANRLLRPLHGRKAYVVTAGLVIAALAVRSLLTPVWGSQHAYPAFYPAVLLSTYVAGRRAGLLATGLAAVIGYLVFVPPAFEVKLTLDAVGYMLFFVANGAVAVVLIAGLNETLTRLAREHEASRTLAQNHANLFREINDRVSHHLHLVACLLALQSNEEGEAQVSDALARASEASITLSRLHREWSGASDEPVAFLPFAKALLHAKLASLGQPPESIVLDGATFLAPVDQATSLGVTLLECATALLGRGQRGPVTIRIEERQGQVAFRVRERAAANGDLASVAEAQLLRAVVQQAGGRVSLHADREGALLQIAFSPPGTVALQAGEVTSRLH